MVFAPKYNLYSYYGSSSFNNFITNFAHTVTKKLYSERINMNVLVHFAKVIWGTHKRLVSDLPGALIFKDDWDINFAKKKSTTMQLYSIHVQSTSNWYSSK